MTKLRRLRLGTATVLTLGLVGVGAAAPAGAASYDLAGLWLLNEGGGQRAGDLSLHGNHGQLGSTAGVDANDPSWVALPKLLFLKRAALHFDGDDFVTVPDSPALEPDGVTVAARVRAPASPGTHRYVLAKGVLACLTASYGLYTGAEGTMRFYVSDGATYTLSPAATTNLWDGAWHTVVGSYDGAKVSLWVDGRMVGSTPATARIGYGLPQSDQLYLGDYGGDCAQPFGFVGDVDAVAVVGSYSSSSVGGLVDQL
jgi:hypothetical protein